MTDKNLRRKKIGARILLLAYPIFYALYVIIYKSWGENTSSINIPSRIQLLLVCAGLTIIFYTEKDIKEWRMGFWNYAGYFFIYSTDALFIWTDKISVLLPFILITLTTLICTICILPWRRKSAQTHG